MTFKNTDPDVVKSLRLKRSLLKKADQMANDKGFQNTSELIRHLIRQATDNE